MRKFKDIFMLSTTIVATVIGAGFATGQEIFSFFSVHGKWGAVGLLFVFILFYMVFETVLLFNHRNSVNGFNEFLDYIHSPCAKYLIEACVAAFSFCGLCAMASATGALFLQSFHIPRMVGVFCLFFVCTIVLLNDICGVAKVNLYLAPLICIGIFLVCVHGILYRDVQTFAYEHYYKKAAASLTDGGVYVSYNLLSVLVVLCSMGSYCKNEKEIKISCLLTSGMLTGLAICIWFVLGIYKNKIMLGDIPLYDIVERSGRAYTAIYSFMLMFSVLTTALGCGYGALDFLKTRYHMTTRGAVFVLMLAAVPICMLEFTEIVRFLYSFFGYLGLPFIMYLFYLRLKLIKMNKS